MTPPELNGSITRMIEEIRGGGSSAVPGVWNRYFSKLAEIAQNGISSSPGRSVDGEDLASAVLETVCRKVGNGQFPQLRDRDDLWLLLLAITRCKVISQIRRDLCTKRGGGRVLLETDVQAFQNNYFDLDDIAGNEPTPEAVVSLRDSCNHLITESLRDETTKAIAILKLEGLSNAEVAARLDIVERTVERKMKVIRWLWEKELGGDLNSGSEGQDTVG